MLVSLFMGFSCGLPLLLTIGLLQAWMKQRGVDLTTIGFMSLVGLPYTVKFLWAPLMDRYVPPFLGRRRGWLLIAQVSSALAIFLLGRTDPGESLAWVSVAAFFVTFCSASQDIVVDAYRREDLTDEELGLGSSLYVYGYRVGMLLASGGGLILADHVSFASVYAIMALCMIPGIATTLLTPEPPAVAAPKSLWSGAVAEPLLEFFRRDGAVSILAFILLYKLGDQMASAMTQPFYMDVGFTLTQIGAVVKVFGTGATLFGAFVGGVLMFRLGIYRALWAFGVLQAVSAGCFAILVYTGPSTLWLAVVIGFENVSAGMGTAAFMAFMASVTNRKFTATQYALLTSLMGVPRVFLSSLTGFFSAHLGWVAFFIGCAITAIPGLLLLLKFSGWATSKPAEAVD